MFLEFEVSGMSVEELEIEILVIVIVNVVRKGGIMNVVIVLWFVLFNSK